jgi:UPF0176 protein
MRGIHSAFYCFARLDDPTAIAEQVRTLCEPLQGSILLAHEGINGMVAGPSEAIESFEHALMRLAQGVFAGMAFKHSTYTTEPFRHMRVKVRKDIVALGLDGVDAVGRKRRALSPREWQALLRRDDVVLLDNRNSFEYRLGRFKGAVDPGVAFFRDFPEYVRAQLPQWQAEGKQVAMYCTGGIRCEKTQAWLQDHGLAVFELEGGILNYLAQVPQAEQLWEGKCFVFDNRVALDAQLQEAPTSIEEVYADEPDGQWRVNRARRLAGSLLRPQRKQAGQTEPPNPLPASPSPERE